MAEILHAILSLLGTEDAFLRSLIAVMLIVVGHLTIKTVQIAGKKILLSDRTSLTKKDIEKRNDRIMTTGYLLNGLVILASLVYLHSGVPSSITISARGIVPDLLSAFLILLLGVLAVNLGSKLGGRFLQSLGIHRYFKQVGFSATAQRVAGGAIKAFVLLAILQISLTQIGVSEWILGDLITASSWAVAILAAGLIFYGFKDVFQDIAGSFYLRNSRMMRPGEEVKIDDTLGEVKQINLLSTTVETEEGYTLMAPNSKLMKSNIRFKRAKSDIETLEDIKSYFVAEAPGFTGPASAEMALDIFGYSVDQEKLRNESESTAESTPPKQLAEAIQDQTKGEVKTAFVEGEKIGSVSDEFKAWFEEGALLIPAQDKSEVFPEQESGEFALAIGVESNEVLIIDPSEKTGGVYFLDSSRLGNAMQDRGYVVVAPKGTTAHWRIENNLIYSDKSYYDELSKTLENRLTKLMRRGKILEDVTPDPVQQYIDSWRSEGYVTRIWEPEGDQQ